MTLHIPDTLRDASYLTEPDLLLRLAIELHREEAISIGRASSFKTRSLAAATERVRKSPVRA